MKKNAACINGYEVADNPDLLVVLVDDHAFEAISAHGSYPKDYP